MTLDPQVLDLPLPLPGFYNFFSAWYGQYRGKTFVVDPGPTASIGGLITQLRARGCHRIDHLLLTHIHLDHAGGTGTLVKNFPVGDITCHSKAVEHLVNPARLWEGSVKTLGELAKVQGEPEPVPSELLIPHDAETLPEVIDSLILTPGHAAHHISFRVNNSLFVGEALGVVLPTLVPNYLRPATPPRFFEDHYTSSIHKLRSVPAERLCFGHFGWLPRTEEIFVTALEQIRLWIEVTRSLKSEEDFLEKSIARLIQDDPHFTPYSSLPTHLQEREKRFVNNSLNGIKTSLE